ncbi:MAG: hypothetical protein IOD15_00115 [Phycisphaerales bacterium]|nr:hypothetical protein [Phycisphaerales bacterium]
MSSEHAEKSVGLLLGDVANEGLVGVVDALMRAGAAADQRPLRFVPMPNDPRGTQVMVKPNGDIELVTPLHPPRSTTALTLGSFVHLVKYHDERIRRASAEQKVTGLNGLAVFVSLDKVLCRLIEGDPHSGEVVLPLRASSGIKALESADKPRTQKEFLQWLRTEVCGEISPSNLLTTLRAVKFVSASEGTAEVNVGRESLSRSVTKEVTGMDKLPEDVMLEVPVWDGIRVSGVDETVSDLCRLQGGVLVARMPFVLDTDIDTRTFRLLPLAGAVEQAKVDALAWLTTHLTASVGEAAVVFSGTDGYRLRPLS